MMIAAIVFKKLLMAALLHNLAILKNHNLIHARNRRETVCNHDTCAAFHEAIQSILD